MTAPCRVPSPGVHPSAVSIRDAQRKNLIFCSMCEKHSLHPSGQRLAVLRREGFDTESRGVCRPHRPPQQGVARISDVQHGLFVGRPLVIIGEVREVESMEMNGRRRLPRVLWHGLRKALCDGLREIFGIVKPSPHATCDIENIPKLTAHRP